MSYAVLNDDFQRSIRSRIDTVESWGGAPANDRSRFLAKGFVRQL